MWYNEKFAYYSNSPGFYAIYFLGKKLFLCYMMYNWDVKIPDKEKKTIIVRNTNLPSHLGLAGVVSHLRAYTRYVEINIFNEKRSFSTSYW